jgi:flagellar biosynthesis/type III secretory pathway protein FliH
MEVSHFSFEVLEPLAALPAPGATAPQAAPAALTPDEELAVARAEAEQLRRAAREQGFQEGFASGHAQALEEAAAGAAALAQAGIALQAEAAAAATRLEDEAVRLALSLAEKIVAGALAVAPELVVDAVRHALRGVVERERVTVLVHPADLDLVQEAMGAIRRELGGMEHVEVQAERRVQAGGAVVRHAAGEIDARIETKLERAREVVQAELGEPG